MFQVLISPRTAELIEMARTGLPEDIAMITIRNYEHGKASITFPQERVLRLCFDDTEVSDRPDAMTQDQANAIYDFGVCIKAELSV